MRFKTDAENLILDLTVFADFSLIASNKTFGIGNSGIRSNLEFFIQKVSLENDS